MGTKKRVAVTGGAGFLGSHLCEKLLEMGHEVISIDNYSTGRRENIAHLLTKPNFSEINHDICFPLYLKADEIYNLASLASPNYFQLDPVKTTQTSVSGAINLLNLAKRNGATILQASISSLGENGIVEKPTLSTHSLSPKACFEEGKRCAETLFFDYHRQYGVKIKVARLFNTYGPRMHPYDGHPLSHFIVLALKEKPITLSGDGEQKLSFCYVTDLVDGLIRFMECDEAFTGPINLGHPEESSLLALSEKILQLTQSKSPIIYKPMPESLFIERKPDISLAKNRLSWQPFFSLEEGLKPTIAYFEEAMKSSALI